MNKIRWAGGSGTPFSRRVQMFAVLTWIATVFPMTAYVWSVVILLSLFVIPMAWPLALAYFAWFAYDRRSSWTGGRPLRWVRNWWLWKQMAAYFPATLHRTVELDPAKKYLFCYHPHGIISIGAFLAFGTDALGFKEMFPGIDVRLITLKMNFWVPFFRELVLSFGLQDASRRSLIENLKKRSVVLVVGGAQESLLAKPGVMDLTLQRRRGFVRIALQRGACLVPVLGLGENELYEQISNPPGSKLRRFQESFKSAFGFAPPFFNGRGVFQYDFGLAPRRHPVQVIVGKPLDIPHIENPSTKEIEHYHKLYVNSLTTLFHEHNTDPNVKIKIT